MAIGMLGSKRGKRSARRVDMSVFRELFADGKIWTGIGLVVNDPDGSGTHFDFDEDIGVLVHVELMPHRTPLMARLGGLGEGATRGVWRVPPVGTEVAIALPGGTVESDPLILAVFASGGQPDELDEDTLVVKGPKIVIICDSGQTVEIKSEGGVAQELATKADVAAVKATFDTHTHILTISSGTGTAAVPATPAPDPAGTTVLKAE